jgi:hypothetical protein
MREAHEGLVLVKEDGEEEDGEEEDREEEDGEMEGEWVVIVGTDGSSLSTPNQTSSNRVTSSY